MNEKKDILFDDVNYAMNFVSRLNNEDYVEIYKLMIKNQFGNRIDKFFVLESEIFNITKTDRKFKKTFYKGKDQYVFIFNKENISAHEILIGFSGDYKERSYMNIWVKNAYLDKKSKIKKFFVFDSNILFNDFDIRWGGPNAKRKTLDIEEHNIDLETYYKFMYKKFGEEYITALKKYNEKESNEKLEYMQKQANKVSQK